MSSGESKVFSIHPNVIKNIILEQAGDVGKAIVELVMNSIDAKATYVDIQVDSHSFVVKDDGVGFKDKNQVIEYFGTFGTPHEENDSTYGVFRIGRGQCFALAKTMWRTGYIGMDVDLNGLEGRSDVGYVIREYEDEFKGCCIEGEFFESLHKGGSYLNASHFNEQLELSIATFKKLSEDESYKLQSLLSNTLPKDMPSKFFARLFELLLLVDLPVYVNGVQITNKLKFNLYKSSPEADFYQFPRRSTSTGLYLLNQGVHITTFRYPVPMLVNFKVKPRLNMARNSISKDCKIYRKVMFGLRRHGFNSVLEGDLYFLNLKDDLFKSLCSYANTASDIISHSTLPIDLSECELDKFLALITVEVFQGELKRLKLTDILNEIFEDSDAFVEKYKRIHSGFMKPVGGKKNLIELLSAKGINDPIIYSINGSDIPYRLMSNLDMLYDAMAVYTDLESVFSSLDQVDVDVERKERIFQIKDGLIVYGDFKEAKPAIHVKYQDLINVLHQAIFTIKAKLNEFFPNLNLQEEHLLVGDDPIEIKLLSLVGNSYQTIHSNDLFNIYHYENKHIFLFDYRRALSNMKDLSGYHGYFTNSIAVKLYLGILEIEDDFKKPASGLHDLRMQNEAMLFEHPEFRNFLHEIDLMFVLYIRQNQTAKKMSASKMKSVQKGLSVYKNFFDEHLNGLSPELNEKINEIISVEV